LNNNSEYKIFLEQLTIFKVNKEKELKDDENKLFKYKQDINDSINIYIQEEIDNKINIYNTLLDKHHTKVKEFNRYIEKNINYNRSLILNEIAKVVMSIAKNQNIDLILESQNYFLSSESIDISQEVVLKLSQTKFSFEIIE